MLTIILSNYQWCPVPFTTPSIASLNSYILKVDLVAHRKFLHNFLRFCQPDHNISRNGDRISFWVLHLSGMSSSSMSSDFLVSKTLIFLLSHSGQQQCLGGSPHSHFVSWSQSPMEWPVVHALEPGVGNKGQGDEGAFMIKEGQAGGWKRIEVEGQRSTWFVCLFV